MSSELPERRYALADDVVIERMGDTTVVVNLASDQIHELNATATRLLDLLGEGKSGSEAAEALADEYDADLDTVRADVERTIALLLEEGLLVPLVT